MPIQHGTFISTNSFPYVEFMICALSGVGVLDVFAMYTI